MNQRKYIKIILKRFNMERYNEVTPSVKTNVPFKFQGIQFHMEEGNI